MVLNILSVCVTVLVLSLHFKDHIAAPPAWLDKVLLRSGKRVSPENILEVKEAMQSEIDLSMEKKECPGSAPVKGSAGCEVNKNREKWKEAAKAINDISFYIFLFGFITMNVVCAILWMQG